MTINSSTTSVLSIQKRKKTKNEQKKRYEPLRSAGAINKRTSYIKHKRTHLSITNRYIYQTQIENKELKTWKELEAIENSTEKENWINTTKEEIKSLKRNKT